MSNCYCFWSHYQFIWLLCWRGGTWQDIRLANHRTQVRDLPGLLTPCVPLSPCSKIWYW